MSEPRDPQEEATPAGIERILRALADRETEDGLPAPPDERLRAYREGRLGEAEARELEGVLARSSAGRRRLLQLAGIDHSLPLRRVRGAVLAAARGRRGPTPWISAALVAAAVVLALLTFFPRQHGLPAGLAYDVGARGLAETREAGEGARSEILAYPDTPVRILVQPRTEGSAGVSFSLFRREGRALLRVRPPEEVRLTSDRGSATFEGPAGRVLATRAPGPHALYVVAWDGEEPPSRLDLAPGQDPAGALRDSGRLVYPVTVNLLREEPPAKDGQP